MGKTNYNPTNPTHAEVFGFLTSGRLAGRALRFDENHGYAVAVPAPTGFLTGGQARGIPVRGAGKDSKKGPKA